MPVSQDHAPAFTNDECKLLLERIASSTHLRRAPRLREFLSYVGRRALEDGCTQLREQEIGVEVFDRSDSYDTNLDNIVRATASELRKRIETYFEDEGCDELLRVEIPRGSYIPVFHLRLSEPATEVDARDVMADFAPETPSPASIAHRNRWQPFLYAVCLLVTACCVGLWIQNRALERALHPWKYSPAVGSLWSPFFSQDARTDLVMEDSSYLLVQTISLHLFPFNDYLSRTYLEQLPNQQLSPDTLRANRIIADKTLARASEVRLVHRILNLGYADKNLHIYNAREYASELLTRENVILFGSPTANPWVTLFQNRMNFTEAPNSTRPSPIVNHSPTRGEPALFESDNNVSHCVIAYLPQRDGHGKILLVEGTTSEATEAGGNFLLSEEPLSGFLKTIHADKVPYFEIVLSVSQITGSPITTSVVAYRTYPNLK